VRADVGDQLGTGGRAPLVVDHGQARLLARQAQHGAGKVAAARGVDPAGAQDQVATGAAQDGLLALQLGLAVDVQRAGGVVLGPGPLALAVKHIVGAVVHQQRAAGGGLARQHGRRVGVDAARQFGLAFGAVDGGVGGGVDDDVGAQLAHRGGQAVGFAQVAAQAGRAAAIQRHQLAQRRQTALQLPAELAVLAQQQDLHGWVTAAPYCVATQSR